MEINTDRLDMFTHEDLLCTLNEKADISEKIDFLHNIAREHYGFVDRVAVAIYDAECDLLKTFAHSTDSGNPLPLYQARLSEASSLKAVVEQGQPHNVNDLRVFQKSQSKHTKQIQEHGSKPSYKVHLYHNR